MKYRQRTEGLRYQMTLFYEDKVSQAVIGCRLGFSKPASSRELRRNCSVDGYRQATAQKFRDARRQAAGKRRMRKDTVFFVESALKWMWNLEKISAVTYIIGRPVRHQWIYQHMTCGKRGIADQVNTLDIGNLQWSLQSKDWRLSIVLNSWVRHYLFRY